MAVRKKRLEDFFYLPGGPLERDLRRLYNKRKFEIVDV